MEPKTFYVERQASGYVGNCLYWWAKDGKGYTCDLDKAHVFLGTDPVFQDIARDPKYRVWDKEYIDSCASTHVDHQRINMDLAGVDGVTS